MNKTNGILDKANLKFINGSKTFGFSFREAILKRKINEAVK